MRASFFYIGIMICSQQLLQAHNSHGQGLDKRVTIGANNETLASLIQKLKTQTDLSFVFPPEEKFEYSGITFKSGNRTLKEVLDLALKGRNLSYSLQDRTVVIYENEVGEDKNDEAEKESMLPTVTKTFSMITGTVKDVSNQEPLAGVNVIVKNTTRGTATDAEGKFAIDANDNEVLVFSFIGFKSYETQVNGRSVIDVSMEADATELGEVVVKAGYWDVKEREKTGNISRVTSQDLERQPISNPLAGLQGRMAGVYVQQTTGVPGGGFNVQIRGTNSIVNGNNPFYIIDGVPVTSQSLSSSSLSGVIMGSSGVSPLNSISPGDIESIEVLKDADATAIYGSRGANGVILITTKKGKAGKTSVNVNLSTGVGKVARTMELLNTTEYIGMRNEAFANDGVTPGAGDFDVNGTWDSNRYTDWQKVLIGGTSNTTNFQTSISGGSGNTQFLLGAGYFKETTVFPGDFAYKKGSTHLNISHRSPNQKFATTFTANYIFDKNNLPNTDLTPVAMQLPPNAPALYDDEGNLNWENSTWTNPLSYLMQEYKVNTNSLVTNAILSYEIIAGLSVKTSLGFNDMRMKEVNLTPSTYFPPSWNATSANAYSFFNNSNVQSWIIEPQIDWQREIGMSRLKVLIGSTFQQTKRDDLGQYAYGFSSDVLIDNPTAASYFSLTNFNDTQYRYNAFFGRVNYDWQSKYIVNVTVRRDGSSRFGPGKQFANFGAIGIAWVLSNEEFIKNTFSFLSFGKIRASYGTTGNDQIADYGYLDSFSVSGPYQGTSSLSPTSLFNPDFAWEVNKKLEAALELGFLNDHILLTASYYQNRSSNQLVGYTLPKTTGFTSVQYNLPATVQNKGLEFELRTINVSNSFFNWTSSINLTIPRNKLIDFPNLAASSYANQFSIGYPLTIKQSYHYLGVDPVSGIYTFQDVDGNGTLNVSDRQTPVFIGHDFYGGLNNVVTFKGLQLDFFFQFTKQSGLNYYSGSTLPGVMLNQPKMILSRWQNEGDITNVEKFTTGLNTPTVLAWVNHRRSEAAVSDASFVRLKTVSLSYQLPDKWVKGLTTRLYLQGQNLLTITNYKGPDPENQSNLYLPPLKRFTAGIQITF